jgi:hypothetical protein
VKDKNDKSATAEDRMLQARRRLDRVLKDLSVGPIRKLPDDTLDLVASCLNEIADLVERRRALDSGQPDQPWVQEHVQLGSQPRYR